MTSRHSAGMLWQRSLRGRLIALLLTIGLVPLIAIATINNLQAERALQQAALNRLADLAASSSDKLDRNLYERYGNVQAFTNTEAAVSMDPARITALMNRLMRLHEPFYRLMLVADLDGRIHAISQVGPNGEKLDTDQFIGRLVVGERWFSTWRDKRIEREDTYIDYLHVDPRVAVLYGDAGYVMGFSHGIYDESNNLQGVWLNLFDWQSAQAMLGELEQRFHDQGLPSVELAIANKAGIVLAGGDPDDVLRTRYILPSSRLRAEAISTGYEEYVGINWRVIASQERSEALQITTRLRLQSMLIAAVSALCVTLVGISAARTVTRPIQTLQQAAQQVASGNLEVVVPTGPDEVGQLGDVFNHMTGELRTLYTDLENQVAQRTATLNATLLDLQRSMAEQQKLAATVSALSIPILPLSDQVLAVPLIGRFDQERLKLLLDRVLSAIEQNHASIVLFDVTGVEYINAAVAEALFSTMQSVKLLGCHPILVGTRPEVAESLVALGLDLSALTTRATLQAGLATARQMTSHVEQHTLAGTKDHKRN